MFVQYSADIWLTVSVKRLKVFFGEYLLRFQGNLSVVSGSRLFLCFSVTCPFSKILLNHIVKGAGSSRWSDLSHKPTWSGLVGKNSPSIRNWRFTSYNHHNILHSFFLQFGSLLDLERYLGSNKARSIVSGSLTSYFSHRQTAGHIGLSLLSSQAEVTLILMEIPIFCAPRRFIPLCRWLVDNIINYFIHI